MFVPGPALGPLSPPSGAGTIGLDEALEGRGYVFEASEPLGRAGDEEDWEVSDGLDEEVLFIDRGDADQGQQGKHPVDDRQILCAGVPPVNPEDLWRWEVHQGLLEVVWRDVALALGGALGHVAAFKRLAKRRAGKGRAAEKKRGRTKLKRRSAAAAGAAERAAPGDKGSMMMMMMLSGADKGGASASGGPANEKKGGGAALAGGPGQMPGRGPLPSRAGLPAARLQPLPLPSSVTAAAGKLGPFDASAMLTAIPIRKPVVTLSRTAVVAPIAAGAAAAAAAGKQRKKAPVLATGPAVARKQPAPLADLVSPLGPVRGVASSRVQTAAPSSRTGLQPLPMAPRPVIKKGNAGIVGARQGGRPQELANVKSQTDLLVGKF